MIYHHKAPTRRANGRALGAMQILNRAYTIACSGVLQEGREDLAQIRRKILFNEKRFCAYKIGQYILGAHSAFGRARLAGAFAAARLSPKLLITPPPLCGALYQNMREALIKTEA